MESTSWGLALDWWQESVNGEGARWRQARGMVDEL